MTYLSTHVKNNFNSEVCLGIKTYSFPSYWAFPSPKSLPLFAYSCAFSCPDELWDQPVKFHRKEIFRRFGLTFHWIYRWLKKKKKSFITHSFPFQVHLPFHILFFYCLFRLSLLLFGLEWFLERLWFLLKHPFSHVIFRLILM